MRMREITYPGMRAEASDTAILELKYIIYFNEAICEMHEIPGSLSALTLCRKNHRVGEINT